MSEQTTNTDPGAAPDKAQLVLLALILVAAVANLILCDRPAVHRIA